jgi:hypothetical protein
MNERIRELHSQCKVSDEGKLLYFDYEKFAELIVEECCSIADQVERADMDPGYVSKYIRAHFGVGL